MTATPVEYATGTSERTVDLENFRRTYCESGSDTGSNWVRMFEKDKERGSETEPVQIFTQGN